MPQASKDWLLKDIVRPVPTNVGLKWLVKAHIQRLDFARAPARNHHRHCVDFLQPLLDSGRENESRMSIARCPSVAGSHTRSIHLSIIASSIHALA